VKEIEQVLSLLRPSPLTVLRRRLDRTIAEIAEPANLTPRQIQFLEDHTLRLSRSTWEAIEACLLPDDRLRPVSIFDWLAETDIRFDGQAGPERGDA
jgi:hypothetical protein